MLMFFAISEWNVFMVNKIMSDKEKLTAVIIDDHPMARLAIKVLLESNNINVLAEADNGNSGLKLFDTLKPDIAIIDVDLPLRSGLDVAKMIRNNNGDCIIVMISSENNHLNNKISINVGAHAFIKKNLGMQNIISAIDAAINGFCYFPFIPKKPIGYEFSETMMLESLSTQEVKVLRYLIKGVDLSSIADEMNISKKTVATYKSRIFKKLECSNNIELYEFSKRNELG